ncbi:MAG: cobalamin-independent methionine synthase II family protein [Bryobacteraceae bacterium]
MADTTEPPSIRTTTVGSYPVPEWFAAYPTEQARIDATRVIFATQREAGIDLPTEGEIYRFDLNHPDTNGMIDYFVGAMSGVRTRLGRSDWEAFSKLSQMEFRKKPAAVVLDELGEGELNLHADCAAAAAVAQGPFKFTVTSPYMLSRSLLDRHYNDFEALTMAIAKLLADQARDLPCSCLQVDEANIPGNPADGPLAARAINLVLDAAGCERAVHLCFGNYGGQVIQKGGWKPLIEFLNGLHADHLVLELAHRPSEDLDALKDIDSRIAIGIGVVDVKINAIETPEEIARRIEKAERTLGPGRVRWVHPDCGFWMLKRSVADRKMRALVKGRDLYWGQASATPSRHTPHPPKAAPASPPPT